MKTLLDMFILSVIIVYVWDISGFIREMKLKISKLITKGKIQTDNWEFKPFTCSTCMTVWSCIGLSIYLGDFSLLYILVSCLLGWGTKYIGQLFILLDSWITKLMRKLL